ncbi:MAG: hypothetical protein A3F98_01890 [Candidatus Yanofskybacteria bacterium RIFCSPLOWO2_12_FULL_41_8]|nr:MAG: hypothetical protein A3F98_01890 [Candidatus Yanofskybacteria bacterium RIFCSPLOWO2_12_FULL_41_8]
MRLVLGSDLHGNLPKVPKCDVLILAGDILSETDQELFIENSLAPWLDRASAKYIVATWGNHDHKPFKHWEHQYNLRWNLLIDRGIIIQGLKFYGTPWCLPIGRWAWQAPEYFLKNIYAMIPDDVDILISHCPPYGICDLAKDSSKCGSKELVSRMESLGNLKFLVCGHIHEARGSMGKVLNVACLDEKYLLRPDPWTIIDV